MNKQIEIHSDDYVGRITKIVGVAIICAPTGIICTAQVGGISCKHPKVEGFTVPLHSLNTEKFRKNLYNFNDCDKGCSFHSKIDKDKMNKYANAVDKFLKTAFNKKNEQQMLFTFDYDRIDELTEGWWPVLVQFSEWLTDKPYDTKFKGYLHFGNCD